MELSHIADLQQAVEFRTHFFNRTSRKAIEHLGAKMEGILRQHIAKLGRA